MPQSLFLNKDRLAGVNDGRHALHRPNQRASPIWMARCDCETVQLTLNGWMLGTVAQNACDLSLLLEICDLGAELTMQTLREISQFDATADFSCKHALDEFAAETLAFGG